MMMSFMLVMWFVACGFSLISWFVVESQDCMHSADFVDVRRRWALWNVVSNETSLFFL